MDEDDLMTPPNNVRRGRRGGDSNETRRAIDPIHMENFILVIGKLAVQGKALEALLVREIAQMQKALDNLKGE